MANPKTDSSLNLAVSLSHDERAKSEELAAGYDPFEDTWDVIVKYSGNIMAIGEAFPEITIVPMLTEYAVISLPQHLLEMLAAYPQIEYIEKPKRLFSGLSGARTASCIYRSEGRSGGLTGRGVIVAVIDSGIDYFHPDFRNEDGSSRILYLWDQTVSGNPPDGYLMGTEYTAEQINEALAAAAGGRQVVPSRDSSGHGTAVAGIAAGNGSASGGRYAGAAPASELIIVRMGLPRVTSFPRTTELMQGIDYVVRKSLQLNRPAAINVSFGNTYGSHNGDSLLETFINDISNIGRTAIVVGSGNEGAAGGHTAGQLVPGQDTVVQLAVGSYQYGFSIQLWKYIDRIALEIVAPGGASSGVIRSTGQVYHLLMGNTRVHLYWGEASPYSMSQEIYMDLIPRGDYVDSGIWSFRIIPEQVVSGTFDMWLPGAVTLSQSTRFFRPSANTTLTIPAAAGRVITVGAYDPAYQSYADFSGRGYTRVTGAVKPDLVAPGINLMAPAAGGGYAPVTGTSFATPLVTGSAALLMEHGIVNGNDPYLYGEKMKAALIRGARPLGSESDYPNQRTGYGALCLENSLLY